MNNNDELTEFLNRVPESGESTGNIPQAQTPTASSMNSPDSHFGDTTQWIVLPDDRFAGGGPTKSLLSAGVYKPSFDNKHGVVLENLRLINDDIIRLPDSASDRVFQSISMFWERKESFKKRGQLFKRGILLWGPPGSGKLLWTDVKPLLEKYFDDSYIIVDCGVKKEGDSNEFNRRRSERRS